MFLNNIEMHHSSLYHLHSQDKEKITLLRILQLLFYLYETLPAGIQKTIGIRRVTSTMMKKVVNSNTTENTIGISAGENGRSINITMQPTRLPVYGHPFRTNFHFFCSLFSNTIFIAVVISGLLFGLIQGKKTCGVSNVLTSRSKTIIVSALSTFLFSVDA